MAETTIRLTNESSTQMYDRTIPHNNRCEYCQNINVNVDGIYNTVAPFGSINCCVYCANEKRLIFDNQFPSYVIERIIAQRGQFTTENFELFGDEYTCYQYIYFGLNIVAGKCDKCDAEIIEGSAFEMLISFDEYRGEYVEKLTCDKCTIW